MWGFLEVPFECPGSWFLTNYGKWSHWRGNNLLLSGVERDNLRLPERRPLNNNFFSYFAIANLFFPQHMWCMFCRASIALWACNWNMCACVRTHTPPPPTWKTKNGPRWQVTTLVKDTLEMHALQKTFEFELWWHDCQSFLLLPVPVDSFPGASSVC